MNDTRNRVRTTLARARANVATIAIGALAGLGGVIGSYAAAGLTPSFVAAPIAGLLSRTLPGALLTAVILTLGSLGQWLNLATAIVIAAGFLAAASIAGVAVGNRLRLPGAGAAIVALLGWAIAAALTGAPVVALGAGLGAGAVVAVVELSRIPGPSTEGRGVSDDRRRLLGALASVAAIGIGAALLRVRGSESQPGAPSTVGAGSSAPGGTSAAGDSGGSERGTDEGDPTPARLLAEADRKSLDVEGIEPLVSEKFYQVDINAADPDLDAGDWSLSITGAVDREMTVDYQALTSMSAEHRFVTLRCVGEGLNAHKMDNALWTGVPVASILEDVTPESQCECVMLRADDGYFEEFPLAALQRGFLAYGMNGRDLPRAHGHPVRALIPGHWGEINVKWLTEIEFLDRPADGYWEKRGWHGTGPVNTVAKLHAVNKLVDGRVQVGGHAYAGLRGVRAVEVSTDGGRTWAAATLSAPLPGEDVWRQWAYEYDPPGGSHEVVVRAIEDDGTVQPKERAEAFPSGATGWVSKTVR